MYGQTPAPSEVAEASLTNHLEEAGTDACTGQRWQRSQQAARPPVVVSRNDKSETSPPGPAYVQPTPACRGCTVTARGTPRDDVAGDGIHRLLAPRVQPKTARGTPPRRCPSNSHLTSSAPSRWRQPLRRRPQWLVRNRRKCCSVALCGASLLRLAAQAVSCVYYPTGHVASNRHWVDMSAET